MAYNFPGSILFGETGEPIYGSSGSPLYSSSMMTQYGIVEVDWGEDDVDICAYWVAGNNAPVGYGHTEGGITETGALAQYWSSSDNTEGGPETVAVGVTGGHIPAGTKWRVHLNWFEGGPGTATVTITMQNGDTRSITSTVARRTNSPANTSDPGVEITFGPNDTVLSMALFNQ